jgi:glycerol-3-phosphate cytidylyltransferase-like family protein
MKIVIASGYYDPLNGPGHIEYFKLSKKIAGPDGKLVIIVNNDHQATLKKGKPFMKCDDRITIIKELRDVDDVIKSVDMDRTVVESIRVVFNKYNMEYKNEKLDFYFCNGGDAFNNSIPEKPICDQLGIHLVDGLGDKISSSSWLTGLKQK